MASSAIAADPAASLNSQIPEDLFVSKKHHGLVPGIIGLADAVGNIVYTVDSTQSQKNNIFHHQNQSFVIMNSSGNALMTLVRQDKGCWQGYKSNGASKDLIFQAKKNTMSDGVKTQLLVFIAKPNGDLESTPQWKLKGNPSQRSCTISDDNSILAQTSLMYKLHQI